MRGAGQPFVAGILGYDSPHVQALQALRVLVQTARDALLGAEGDQVCAGDLCAGTLGGGVGRCAVGVGGEDLLGCVAGAAAGPEGFGADEEAWLSCWSLTGNECEIAWRKWIAEDSGGEDGEYGEYGEYGE